MVFRETCHLEHKMTAPFYIPAHVRDELLEKITENTVNCFFCGVVLKRKGEQHVDLINYDVSDEESAFDFSNALLCCKECKSNRRRRPVSVYVDEKYAEVSVELAWLSTLRSQLVSEALKGVAKPQKSAQVSKKVVVEKKPEDDDDAVWDEYVQLARKAEEKTQSSYPISENTQPLSEVTKPDLQELVDGWDEEE
jgi:hypothetical protein